MPLTLNGKNESRRNSRTENREVYDSSDLLSKPFLSNNCQLPENIIELQYPFKTISISLFLWTYSPFKFLYVSLWFTWNLRITECKLLNNTIFSFHDLAFGFLSLTINLFSLAYFTATHLDMTAACISI